MFTLGCSQLEHKDFIADHSDLYSDYIPQLEDVSLTMSNPLRFVNIHCTASKGDLSKEWLLNFFKNERGWSKPGYNLSVRTDGSIDTLVYFNKDAFITYGEVSFGVSGRNYESLNIVYTGGVDNKLKPLDTRTEAQKETLQRIVYEIRCFAPNVMVLGHRDHKSGSHKACPSFDAIKEYSTPIMYDPVYIN